MELELRTMLDDLLISLVQYLDRSLPHIKAVADRFYKQADQQPWEEFGSFMEALEWIFQAYSSLDKNQSEQLQYKNWHMVANSVTKLVNQLHELDQAVSRKDSSLVGDLIQYEIIPILEELRQAASTIVDNEVVRHDVN